MHLCTYSDCIKQCKKTYRKTWFVSLSLFCCPDNGPNLHHSANLHILYFWSLCAYKLALCTSDYIVRQRYFVTLTRLCYRTSCSLRSSVEVTGISAIGTHQDGDMKKKIRMASKTYLVQSGLYIRCCTPFDAKGCRKSNGEDPEGVTGRSNTKAGTGYRFF